MSNQTTFNIVCTFWPIFLIFLIVFVLVVGSIIRYITGELEYRRLMKILKISSRDDE